MYLLMNTQLFTDFCNVAGPCDLLTSPWLWAEASLVPWQGADKCLCSMFITQLQKGILAFYLELFDPKASFPFMFVSWQEWSYLRGGLTTVDRDYGWFNNIHHDIGTHVIHHLFPQIPHYHLVEAVLSFFSITLANYSCILVKSWFLGFFWYFSCRLMQLNQCLESTIASQRDLGHFQFTWSRI